MGICRVGSEATNRVALRLAYICMYVCMYVCTYVRNATVMQLL